MEFESRNRVGGEEELVTSRIPTGEYSKSPAAPGRSGGNGGDKSGESSLLGPDGEALNSQASNFSSAVSGLVERNPMLATALSVGFGLIVGMVIGAAVARD